MAKVLGLGGLFFKAADEQGTRAWYARVLGIEPTEWGGTWFPAAAFAAQPGAGTVFNVIGADSDYLDPSAKEFMFNFVVDDLDGVLARCREHGVEPVKTFPEEGNGRFAHILDPEGRKIELWEPKLMPDAP
jgi:predicted enzyme related to lactoylglutathione lyase